MQNIKFRIAKDEFIGRGSFGEVYKAYDINDKSQIYAAKLIPSELMNDPNKLNNFSNEILIGGQFTNKNLVKLKGLENDENNNTYMILEYCNGGDLFSFTQKFNNKYKRNLNEKEIQKILKDILYGLSCLHRNNIIHYDIKPTNILLNYEKEEDKNNLNIFECTFKIADFGLAKYSDLTKKYKMSDSIGGTVQYMPPEFLLKGDIKASLSEYYDSKIINDKVDIWALGILSYKLKFWSHPFIPVFDFNSYLKELKDNIREGYYKIIIEENKNISKELLSFIDSCLKEEQDLRKSSEDLEYSRFITRDTEKFHFVDIENINEEIPKDYIDGDLNLMQKEIRMNIYKNNYIEEEFGEKM